MLSYTPIQAQIVDVCPIIVTDLQQEYETTAPLMTGYLVGCL